MAGSSTSFAFGRAARSCSMILATISGVIGSMEVASASSGSVMVMAGAAVQARVATITAMTNVAIAAVRRTVAHDPCAAK